MLDLYRNFGENYRTNFPEGSQNNSTRFTVKDNFTTDDLTGSEERNRTFEMEVVISGILQRIVGEVIEINREEDNIQNNNNILQQLFKDVSNQLSVAYEQSAKFYNQTRWDEKFIVDQDVWRRNHYISDAFKNFSAKLADKFSDPFRI